MGIGKRIKEARERLGLTQNELGELIGVTGSAITNYEKETSHPKEPVMYKLFDALHVDANYLFQDVVNIPSKANDVTLAEYECIKKYRNLDPLGRQHVDTVLAWETERVFHQTLRIENEVREDEVPVYILNYYQRLASAGSGEYLFDNIPTDTMEVPVTALSAQADFVIGVNGESMKPTYSDGDKVYVKITDEIPTGSIGLFTRGNDCFIKELGVNCLISHNHADGYEDIPASEDIKLVGEVLGKIEED